MRPAVWGIVWSALALMACASEGDGESATRLRADADADATDDSRSSTPRITVGDASHEMDRALLGEEDVADILGLRHTRVTPIEDAERFENPDPRGPCGAEVEAFSAELVAGRVFTTSGTSVVENLYTDVEAMARDMDALEQDLVPGCESHESLTNIGTTQQVSAPIRMDLAGVGDRALGWSASITSGPVTVDVGAVFVIDGDRGFLLQVIGDAAIDDGAMVDLAERATERLHA